MAEVDQENHKALLIKTQKIVEEQELDQKIVRYNEDKAQREEEILQEKIRISKEKEKETQRLRELQEKASDRQSEIDALRAKRAFEESERLERLKEKREQEKKLQVLREMEEAREVQFLEKERLLAEQAKQERDEFLRIVNEQKETAEKEKQIDDEKKNILYGHSKQLRSQIQQNNEVVKQDRLDYLEEGRLVRQKLESDRLKVEKIKYRKLNELKGLGIDEKYQADLAKKKIV